MTPIEIKAEIVKQMILKEVNNKELPKICGKSYSTMNERMRNPEKLTLGDLMNIGSYLGMKVTMQ